MFSKSLGQELLGAVKKAIATKGRGKIVRPAIDIALVRKNLGMTQKKFSEEYFIKLQTLRNWEQEKRIPDATSLAYLTCIAQQPKQIWKMLHQ